MKLSIALGYMTGRDRPADAVQLAQYAETLGFDTVWASESYGADAVSMLGFIAGQTEKINIGSAVLQIPGRTPAMTAMTSVGLDAVSGGAIPARAWASPGPRWWRAGTDSPSPNRWPGPGNTLP